MAIRAPDAPDAGPRKSKKYIRAFIGCNTSELRPPSRILHPLSEHARDFRHEAVKAVVAAVRVVTPIQQDLSMASVAACFAEARPFEGPTD